MNRRLRRTLIVVGALAGLVVVVRIIADAVATRLTRSALAKAQGIHGVVEGVHVEFIGPRYEVKGLKVVEAGHDDETGWRRPLFYVRRIDSHLSLRHLLQGLPLARVRLEAPKVIVRSTGGSNESPNPPDLHQTLSRVLPFKLERLEIVDGEIDILEADERPGRLWISDIELAVENLASRRALSQQVPMTVTARARVERSGVLTVFLTVDPFAKGLTFGGRASLKDLRLHDLHDFIAPRAKVQVPRGTLSLFADLDCKAGILRGGIKPVLANVDVAPLSGGIGDRFRAWAADRAISIVSDRVAERNAVATVIPVRGTMKNPEFQPVPAILGVVRNAFVLGVTEGFAGLPPPTAPEKQGVLEQAADALRARKGAPKAQPERSL